MATEERRIEHCEMVSCVAVCAPAVRMVNVEVWFYEGEHGVRFNPVIALRETSVRRFAKICYQKGQPAEYPTPEMMLDNGWSYIGMEARSEALVVDCDGLINASDDVDNSSNTVSRLVVCPWPADEDHERLKQLVEELAAEAKEKEEHNQAKSRKAQQDAQPAK